MSKAISVDRDIMSGTPVFSGTRVPLSILFDYLEDDKFAEFLENYPTVSREQATEVIKLAAKLVSDDRIIDENLN